MRVEREGPVVTVILDRAAHKNAVDRATAEQLADTETPLKALLPA